MESVDIKDIQGNLRFSTLINEGSKRKFLLMKEDYITLNFSLDNPVYFQLGDGIDNELGIFELIDLYKPSYNTTTGAYDYELRLDAYYWKWKNKKFFYTPESTGREAGWNLTATLKTHAKVFIDNLMALGYKFRGKNFVIVIDDTVKTTSKLVSYDNVNLIDALTKMVETWECEWWITENIIHFGRCEYSTPVDFKAGDLQDTENVNVNSMQRSDSQTSYATRVYAFGSTRNIPASYRKSLIFDVKKVDGRIISDTARPLSNIFFPSSTKIEGGLYLKFPPYGMYNFPESQSIASKTDQKTFSGLLSGGKYKIKVTSFSCEFLGGDRTDGLKDFIKLEAWLTYNTQGEVKQLAILSEEKSIPQTPAGTKVYLDIPSKEIEFVLPDDSSEIIIATKWSAKRVRSTDSYNVGMYALNYVPVRAYSSPVIVTFLSGINAGKSYQAIYNATFLPEPDSNFIFLPEGVTASIGDRYTINNIIKGKVPDNYFSKDDKELTLNGVVQKRLMLPEGIPYVDAYRYSPTGERIDLGDERYDNADNVEMLVEEAIEEIVTFDEEYPKYIGTLSNVSHEEKDEEDDDGNKTGNKYPIYTFKDTGLKNFTEDFLLDELRLVFQSGSLNGMDFAINLVSSDSTGTTFEIVRNEDYGRYLPDDVLAPEYTNTYILYGFDTAFISEQMLPDSEVELFKTTKKYVKKSMIDPSTYDCEMDADFIYNNGNIRTYEVGDKINLINRAYFTNGRQSRIIGFEWPLDIPYDHPIYTVGETAAYSRIGEIENKLDNLTYKGQTYSGSISGSGGTSVYVIGVNDKTLPSDRNTFSAKRIINEIEGRSLSKVYDDEASGHITLKNGGTSQELFEANNCLVVRKTELVEEASLMSLSEEYGDTIIEEGEDSLIEELSTDTPVAGSTTLGGLENVSTDADTPSATDDLLVRLPGSSEWTVNSSLFSQVSQLMTKVFPFTMTLSGGGTYEKGSSQTVNLSWTYDRDIESQSINNESLLIGIRAKQYANVATDTTYTLKAIQGGQTYSKSVSAQFKVKKYYGVSANETLTNSEILSLSSAWAQRTQGSTVFNCTGGKYPYYVLPTSMVSGIQFWIGGLRNTDWSEEVRDVTNAYGHTESYTIFRLNSIQTGVLNIEVK